MPLTHKLIRITVLISEQEQHLTTYQAEYRSVMDLLTDKLWIDEFGQCKGTGRCGTCLVQLSDDDPAVMERNEVSTLAKSGITLPNLRLACQITIDENIDGKIIKIVQGY